MAQVLTKYAAKKVLGRHMEKYKEKEPANQYDPYYAYIENPKKPGKLKKVKKQVPDYIPEHDAVILADVRKRAYMLDCCLFNFLGIRFGWSSVVGIIPAAGDALDAALAIALIARCREVKCGLGGWVFFRMVLNIFMDFFVGLIPMLGDLADAAYKANTLNLRLLEERLDEAYKPKGVEVPTDRNKKRHSAAVFEDLSDDGERLPMYIQETGVQRPAPTKASMGTRPSPGGYGERREARQVTPPTSSRSGRR